MRKNQTKFNINQIRDIVSENGFELLNKKYTGCRAKMYLRDNEGYLYETTFFNFYDKNRKPSRYHIYNSFTLFKLNCY